MSEADTVVIEPPAPKPKAKSTLASALVAAQAAMPTVSKNATNPHFKSKFVSLDALIEATRPVLNEHGLSLSQWPTVGDLGQPVLRTILTHGPTGQQLEADMPLMVSSQNMQQLGSAITYARRYAWASVLGVASEEDDDANTAVQQTKTSGNTITDDQRRRLFAIARDKAVGEDLLRQIIEDVTGDRSTSSITPGQYDEIVALVEAEEVPF